MTKLVKLAAHGHSIRGRGYSIVRSLVDVLHQRGSALWRLRDGDDKASLRLRRKETPSMCVYAMRMRARRRMDVVCIMGQSESSTLNWVISNRALLTRGIMYE